MSARPFMGVAPGQRFERLVVRHRVESTGPAAYECLCDCGRIVRVRGYDLRRGVTRSCGCYNRDVARARALSSPNPALRHGHARRTTPRSPAYKSWKRMKTRCRHEPGYVDRGIRVCERWQTFDNFLADMGEPPPGLTIDRIDNNGDYEPYNCRWATSSEQQTNKRSNVRLTLRGVSKTAAEWCRDLGISQGVIYSRVAAGWRDEDVLTRPIALTRPKRAQVKG